jgi:hypothetical protein
MEPRAPHRPEARTPNRVDELVMARTEREIIAPYSALPVPHLCLIN